METYRVGVTGHRTLLKKRNDIFENTTEFLRQLKADHPEGLEVNTGMALGFDQLVCDVCIDLGIPYVAVVPCDAQDSLWNPQQKERYAKLLSLASRVVEVSPGPYAAWKMHARNGWIVNNSDEMVVHWDGYFQGGTGSCMKLVRAKKLPVKNTITIDA
jgi:uncharacterized phage-like protein YoqJ